MIGEVVSVGTELLLGQITNTNARFLAETLAGLGIEAYFQQTVGDNRARLRQALDLALARSDLVITVGGLGPTEDDLTKEVVAEALGLPLVEDEKVAAAVRCVVRRHGSQPPAAAVAKQSLVPQGAVVLPNPSGTAPGLLLAAGAKLVALLPGPPPELEAIVKQHLVSRLEGLLARREAEGTRRVYLRSRVVKLCGIGEAAVEDAVRDLVRSPNPTVAPLVGVGEVHLRVTARASRPEEAARLAQEMVGRVRGRLEAHIFGYDEETLAGACGELLRRAGLTLAVAESLTGGLVGHLLTETPGSSAYFDRSLVLYSNAAKIELAGVDPEVLRRHGAVSPEVALAMAEGVRRASRTDLGLALTGIAGPSGARPGKPVGLVHIALAGGRKEGLPVLVRCEFGGDRGLVKLRSAQRALTLLWESLKAGR